MAVAMRNDKRVPDSWANFPYRFKAPRTSTPGTRGEEQ